MKLCVTFLLIALGSCASSSSSRTVYLLGRFPAPHSKPQLASSLRSAGHVVAPAMTSDVDLVVVGLDPVSEDGSRFLPVREVPEYAIATARDTEIIDRNELAKRLPQDQRCR